MAALTPGAAAPEISLQNLAGKKFSLADARRRGPVLAAFFKAECPTCQYAFPFLERIHQAYGNGKVTMVGIAQNEKDEALDFLREYGVTFPTILDDTRNYPASNAYGLTNVPSIFLISPNGKVEFSTVGWDRKDIEKLNARMAELSGSPRAEIFKRGEQVADWKSG